MNEEARGDRGGSYSPVTVSWRPPGPHFEPHFAEKHLPRSHRISAHVEAIGAPYHPELLLGKFADANLRSGAGSGQPAARTNVADAIERNKLDARQNIDLMLSDYHDKEQTYLRQAYERAAEMHKVIDYWNESAHSAGHQPEHLMEDLLVDDKDSVAEAFANICRSILFAPAPEGPEADMAEAEIQREQVLRHHRLLFALRKIHPYIFQSPKHYQVRQLLESFHREVVDELCLSHFLGTSFPDPDFIISRQAQFIRGPTAMEPAPRSPPVAEVESSEEERKKARKKPEKEKKPHKAKQKEVAEFLGIPESLLEELKEKKIPLDESIHFALAKYGGAGEPHFVIKSKVTDRKEVPKLPLLELAKKPPGKKEKEREAEEALKIKSPKTPLRKKRIPPPVVQAAIPKAAEKAVSPPALFKEAKSPPAGPLVPPQAGPLAPPQAGPLAPSPVPQFSMMIAAPGERAGAELKPAAALAGGKEEAGAAKPAEPLGVKERLAALGGVIKSPPMPAGPPGAAGGIPGGGIAKEAAMDKAKLNLGLKAQLKTGITPGAGARIGGLGAKPAAEPSKAEALFAKKWKLPAAAAQGKADATKAGDKESVGAKKPISPKDVKGVPSKK